MSDEAAPAVVGPDAAELAAAENARFHWHVVRNALQLGAFKMTWQLTRRRILNMLASKVRAEASLGSRMDSLNTLVQHIFPGGSYIRFRFAASPPGAPCSGQYFYGQWSRDCFETQLVVNTLCVAMSEDPLVAVREGAAIALAELQSRDETTKHSLCSAIASAPLSVSAEAASVLERLLFPTDRWSDGLDGIDLELLGTLSLLCESGLGPDARSWTCSRSLEHLGLVPSRGEVLPPELTKACASQGLVYAAGTLIGSLGDVGVREVEHDEEADAAPKSRRKFPLFPLFREPMMAICPHGMNTRAAVPCSCGANATRSVAIPWEGGEKGGKENAAGISKLSLIGSMLVVTSGGPTGLVSEAREVVGEESVYVISFDVKAKRLSAGEGASKGRRGGFIITVSYSTRGEGGKKGPSVDLLETKPMRSASGPDWGRVTVPLNLIVEELLEDVRREGEDRSEKEDAGAGAKRGRDYVDRAKLLNKVLVFEVTRISADSGGKRKRCILTTCTLGRLLGVPAIFGREVGSVELREAKKAPLPGLEKMPGQADPADENKGSLVISDVRLQFERRAEVLHPFAINCDPPGPGQLGAGATFVVVGKKTLRAAVERYIACQSDANVVDAEWKRRGILPQILQGDESSRAPVSLGGEVTEAMCFEGAIAVTVCGELSSREHADGIARANETRKAAAKLVVKLISGTYSRRKQYGSLLGEDLALMASEGVSHQGVAHRLFELTLAWFEDWAYADGAFALKSMQAAAARSILSSDSAVRKAALDCAVECARFAAKVVPVDEDDSLDSGTEAPIEHEFGFGMRTSSAGGFGRAASHADYLSSESDEGSVDWAKEDEESKEDKKSKDAHVGGAGARGFGAGASTGGFGAGASTGGFGAGASTGGFGAGAGEPAAAASWIGGGGGGGGFGSAGGAANGGRGGGFGGGGGGGWGGGFAGGGGGSGGLGGAKSASVQIGGAGSAYATASPAPWAEKVAAVAAVAATPPIAQRVAVTADKEKYSPWGTPNPTKFWPAHGIVDTAVMATPMSKSRPSHTSTPGAADPISAPSGGGLGGSVSAWGTPNQSPTKGGSSLGGPVLGGGGKEVQAPKVEKDLTVKDEWFELTEEDVRAGWKMVGKAKRFKPPKRDVVTACCVSTVERIVMRALKDVSPAVRMQAISASAVVSALQGPCGSWHTTNLVASLADQSSEVRLTAIHALAEQCQKNDSMAMWGDTGTWTISFTFGVSSLLLFQKRVVPVRSFVRVVRRQQQVGDAAWKTHEVEPNKEEEKLFPFVDDDFEDFVPTAKDSDVVNPVQKKWEEAKARVQKAMEEGADVEEKLEQIAYDEIVRTKVVQVDWRHSGIQQGMVAYEPVTIPWDLLLSCGPGAQITVEVWEAGPRGNHVLVASNVSTPANLLAPERPMTLRPKGGRILLQVSADKVSLKGDHFGEPALMLVVMKHPEGRIVHACPPIEGTANPKWDPMSLSLEVLFRGGGEGENQFTLEVWDYDSGGQHSVIGTCLVSVDDAVSSQVIPLKDPDSPTDFVGSLELSGAVVSLPDAWHPPLAWDSMAGRDSSLFHTISTLVEKPLPGLAGLIGVGSAGGGHAPADASPDVRAEAVKALVKLGSRGDERVVNAILAVCKDSDSLVRCTALKAASEVSWTCDERVVELLCLNSQTLPFLDRVRVPGTANDWSEMREAAISCLEHHFSLGWGCVQVCGGQDCVQAIITQAKEMRKFINKVLKELEEFKREIMIFESRGDKRELSRLMHKMLHHKARMEDVVVQELNSFQWIITEYMQTQAMTFPLRCLSFDLLLQQCAVSPDEWYPPMCIPSPPPPTGECRSAIRRFSHLDGHAMIGRASPAAAEKVCARARIEEELNAGNYCRFRSQGWGLFATRRPPCLPGSGGVWRGTGDDSVSGEAVVTSLWFPPLVFPRRNTRRGVQKKSVGGAGGSGPPDSTIAWKASRPGDARIANQRHIASKIAVIRCDLTDAALVSECVTRLQDSKAICIIIIGNTPSLIPPSSACQALDDCRIPVLCLSQAQGDCIVDGAWLDVGIPKDDAQLSALTSALRDPCRGVRAAACRALAKVGATWGLHHPGGAGVDLVTGQVEVVAREDGTGTVLPLRTRGNDAVVKLLADMLESEKDDHVRCEAVKALGAVAACGDEFARDAAERALYDYSSFVREAASMAVVKLTRTAEMIKQAREDETRAKERRGEAHQTQRKLTNLLTGLIADNKDLELARVKSFELAWTVDPESGRGASWPVEKFAPPKKENGEEEDESEWLALITPQRLAWAGFFYTPDRSNDDRVTCFSCGTSYHGWRPTEDIMSKHSKTCAYNNQAKGIKEFVPVAPPLVDEAKARGWEGSVWRFVGDEDTEAKLNGIADLAAALEERKSDFDSMQILISEAKTRIKEIQDGTFAGQRALSPLMSDPVEEVSNNAFMAFLDAIAD